MNYPFKKKHIRLLSLVLALTLVAGLFAGCGKTEVPESTPPTEDNLPPGLVEVKPTETSAPTTEATEPIDENAAVINKDNTKVRQTPSADADPIGTLNKGTEVTIIREVSIAGVGWTLIREGWVATEALDKSYVPDTTEPTTIQTPAQMDPNNQQNNNNNNNNNTTTDKPTTDKPATNNVKFNGIVTASELNIRKEARQDSDKVGSYRKLDRVSILETSNGWGRTDKGWISLNYVYQDGTTGSNPCSGIVTATQLNIRSGPGTNYDKVDSVNYLGRVNVLEQFTIGNTTWGCVKGGWISMEYVYVDGTEGKNTGEGTVNGNNVNVRSGPGTGYNAIGSKDFGDPVTIMEQFEIGDRTWGCLKGGGWIAMEFVNMG